MLDYTVPYFSSKSGYYCYLLSVIPTPDYQEILIKFRSG